MPHWTDDYDRRIHGDPVVFSAGELGGLFTVAVIVLLWLFAG